MKPSAVVEGWGRFAPARDHRLEQVAALWGDSGPINSSALETQGTEGRQAIDVLTRGLAGFNVLAAQVSRNIEGVVDLLVQQGAAFTLRQMFGVGEDVLTKPVELELKQLELQMRTEAAAGANEAYLNFVEAAAAAVALVRLLGERQRQLEAKVQEYEAGKISMEGVSVSNSLVAEKRAAVVLFDSSIDAQRTELAAIKDLLSKLGELLMMASPIQLLSGVAGQSLAPTALPN